MIGVLTVEQGAVAAVPVKSSARMLEVVVVLLAFIPQLVGLGRHCSHWEEREGSCQQQEEEEEGNHV